MSSSGSNATCDRSIDERKKENFSFLESVTTAHSEVHVDPPVVIDNPVKPPQDQQAAIAAPPSPSSQQAPLSPPPPTTSPQTPPATSPPPKEVTPSTPSPCLYVRFEAEAFHLTNEQNNLPQGDPGLRTFGDFMKRFVSGDEQTIKNVMCKYWSVTKINDVPLSKRDSSGNLLEDKMYRVPCDKTDIGALITAFKRYEGYLESPENKTELDTKQHFNPAAQIEYVKVYLQRLTDAQTNPPKDCIGLHETIPGASTSAATAGKGGDGTDRYYGVLPKVFYLLYNQSKTGQSLKAQELLNTYSSLTQDPDELLKAVADDKGPSSHSDIFEPVPVSVLALMNLISEKFPHIYKLKMGTGTGVVDSTHKDTYEEIHSDPNEIKTGLADILQKIFEKDDQAKKTVEDDFIEAHDKYNKKDTKGAVSSIHNALTKIVDHLKTQTHHTETLSTSTAGQAQPAPKPVEAIAGQDSDKEELAKKDAEIADLKAQLAKCSGESKACDEKIAALEAQKATLEGVKNSLEEELKKSQSEPKTDPIKVAGIEQAIAKARSDLEALTKELEAEKAKSAECNTELAAVKVKNAELEKQLVDSTSSKTSLMAQIAALEANRTDPAELERLRDELKKCDIEKRHINEELRTNVSEAVVLRNKIAALEAELTTLRATGSQSEADKARITELEGQLDTCRKERIEYQKKMEKEVKDLRDRINHIVDEKSIIEKRLKIIEGEKGVSDTESIRLRSELGRLQAELEKCRNETAIQIKELRTEIERITREKASLEGGKGESDLELARLQAELEASRKAKADLELILNKVNAENIESHKQIDSLNKSISEKEAQLAAALTGTGTSEEAIKKLSTELTGLREQLTKITTEANKLRAENATLKSEIAKLKDVEERMKRYRTERDSLKARSLEDNTSLTARIRELEELLNTATKESAVSRKELEVLRAEKEKGIRELTAKIAQLEADLIVAQHAGEGEIADISAQLAATKNALDESKAAKATVDAALGDERKKSSKLEAQLAVCNQEKSVLQSRIKVLEQQLSDVQNALTSAESGNEEVEQLYTMISNLQKQLKDAQEKSREVDALRSKLAAAEETVKKVPGLDAEVRRLNGELAVAEEKANSVLVLESQIRDLQAELLSGAQDKSRRVSELQSELDELRRKVRVCDQQIVQVKTQHTQDIQVVLNALKSLMSPIAGQLGQMDPELGQTQPTINAIESLGSSNDLNSLQRNMQSAVQSLTAYLGGANINFNKWKQLFERAKSTPVPYVAAYTPPLVEEAPKPYVAAPAAVAPTSKEPNIYILTIKTKKGIYPEKTIKIVAAQKMDSTNYTRATESSISRELNEENIKRCMNSPSANFCKIVERGIEQSEFDNIEYIISAIKRYGFQVTKEGPVTQQDADDIKFSRSRQRGGAKYPHGQRDVRYRPDSLKSLAEHQRIWEELKESYDALPEEYKKILPTPGRPPIAHTLEPFTRYIDENAEEDPESIEEARDATDLLGPEEVDEMLESDGETPAMERVKPYYKKALPNLKEEWLPVMIRADIVSRIINDRIDDM